MDLINANTVVVIEYSRGISIYPVHEVIVSEEYLPIEGLLQACEEFVFSINNSALTIKKVITPFPLIKLFVENYEEPSTLTISYYDLHDCSLSVKMELLDLLPQKWFPSKDAIKSFPQILGDEEMKEDPSILNGYTEVSEKEKEWVDIKETNLTGFLKKLVDNLDLNKELVFKIPIYPLVEIQDLDKLSTTRLWLVKERV